MPQDLLLPITETSNRTIKSEDLDIYKSKLLSIIRSAYDLLDSHKENYQKNYKKFYDKNKKIVEYKIGEKVRVHFPVPDKEGLNYKLGTRWRGPYEIVQKIDAVTYRVRKNEPFVMKTMPVLVQRLKRAVD